MGVKPVAEMVVNLLVDVSIVLERSAYMERRGAVCASVNKAGWDPCAT